jgi:hypothetical protein
MVAEPLPEQPSARAQRIGLRRALAGLRDAGTAPADDRDAWNRTVIAALTELRAALARHAEFTEGPDGLFAEVREQEPRLVHRVQQLEGEHGDLENAVDRCAGDLAGSDAATAAASVAAVATAFERHVHRGAELVYDAYNVDISSGD